MSIKTIFDIWRQYRINDPEQRMSALINSNNLSGGLDNSQMQESIRIVHCMREKQKH